MKKNIVIIFLILVSMTLIVYAKIKANEAEKAASEAQLSKEEGEKLRDAAVMLQQNALEEAAKARAAEAEALRQKQIADMATLKVQECQSK